VPVMVTSVLPDVGPVAGADRADRGTGDDIGKAAGQRALWPSGWSRERRPAGGVGGGGGGDRTVEATDGDVLRTDSGELHRCPCLKVVADESHGRAAAGGTVIGVDRGHLRRGGGRPRAPRTSRS